MSRFPSRPSLHSVALPAPGWQRLFGLLLVLALLAACQPHENTPTTTQPGETRLPVDSAAAEQQLPTSPSDLPAEPTLVLQAPPEEPAQPTTTPLTTLAPDPLRFTFPTPGPASLSAWRPPLYPVPWAPTLHDHFYFARPIAADEVNWPVANYRYGGEFFENVVHTGVDIPAPLDTPVLSAGPGRVVWAGYGVYRGGYDLTDPYGMAVTIRHDFGYQDQPLYTIYGHLSQIDVAEGQYVNTGDPIGLVGETGHVTGPHLHFEVRLGENSYFNTRNPELWTVPPIGWGVLAGRIMDRVGSLRTGQQIILTDPDTGQNFFARSYGNESVNSDPYYLENLVIGDLPAGVYVLRTAYAGFSHRMEIEIFPGRVSYFVFRGQYSFSLEDPPQLEFEALPYATPTP